MKTIVLNVEFDSGDEILGVVSTIHAIGERLWGAHEIKVTEAGRQRVYLHRLIKKRTFCIRLFCVPSSPLLTLRNEGYPIYGSWPPRCDFRML